MASQVKGWAGQIEDDDGTLHALGSTAYGYCQTAAATAAKVVDMTGFKLVTGATIFVKFQYANSVANPTLNVNSTGAKPIYRYGTTRPSTNTSTNGWPAGAVLAFTYDGSGWQEHYWYNNQYTLSNLYHGSGNFVADSAVYRYQLLFHTDRDTLTPLNNNDNVTGTTKTMLTNVDFDPFAEIYYYNSTTNVAAGGAVGGGACYWSMSSFDMRYSFNCGDSSLTAHRDVYLKCSRQANGMFRIASASPLTQVLPSGNDGYYYIQLGRATSGYQMTLHRHHPIYYHDGNALRFYTDPAKAVPFAALTGSPTDNSALNTALSAKANTADLGGMAAVDDAPSDGKEYLRKNGTWVKPSGGSGVPDGGTIGQVLAKRSDADGDAGWYNLRDLPSDKWYLPNGITESDVIAAYQFVDQADETAALANINDGTSYLLSKVLGTETWSADKGFYIPGTRNAGLENASLAGQYANMLSAGFGYSGANTPSSMGAGIMVHSSRALELATYTNTYTGKPVISAYSGTAAYLAGSFNTNGVLAGNWANPPLMYHDGAAVSLSQSGNIYASGRGKIFGHLNEGGTYSSCYITALVFYNVTLSASQHLELSDNIRALGGIA